MSHRSSSSIRTSGIHSQQSFSSATGGGGARCLYTLHRCRPCLTRMAARQYTGGTNFLLSWTDKEPWVVPLVAVLDGRFRGVESMLHVHSHGSHTIRGSPIERYRCFFVFARAIPSTTYTPVVQEAGGSVEGKHELGRCEAEASLAYVQA